MPETKDPQLFETEAFIWTVDSYCDSVRKRKKKTFDAEEGKRQQLGLKPARFFASELGALMFVVDRAHRRVADAEHEAARARVRLRKCEQRLGTAQQTSGDAA